MPRTLLTRLATAVAVTAGLTGLTIAAAPEEGALEKLMEKVQAKNVAVTKGVRTKVAFAKDHAKVVTAAEDLVKLGKESRVFKEPAEKQKKAQSEWEKLTDDFIKTSEELVEAVKKPGVTQEQAKKAHNAVKASCTNCHNVFKVEDEN